MRIQRSAATKPPSLSQLAWHGLGLTERHPRTPVNPCVSCAQERSYASRNAEKGHGISTVSGACLRLLVSSMLRERAIRMLGKRCQLILLLWYIGKEDAFLGPAPRSDSRHK